MNEHSRIAANETELLGAWKVKQDRVVADPNCERIEWLTSNHLLQLGADSSGWDELYRDPDDGRLWELTWPQSEMHGGGPPRLVLLSTDAARAKYGAVVDT
ncbi:MAG: Imm27 family immunity protein [Gammaproteobacteria bacterium]|nr:Imm27 family immunity protein [Gammaproteobacteria bacterium]